MCFNIFTARFILFRKLKAFAQHPTTQLAAGLVLVISGMAEVIYDLMSVEHSFRLGVHHGVLLFGLVQVLGSFPEFIEGMERTFEAMDKRQK